MPMRMLGLLGLVLVLLVVAGIVRQQLARSPVTGDKAQDNLPARTVPQQYRRALEEALQAPARKLPPEAE